SAHAATLHGEVNPVGVELASCEFEYGPNTVYGHRADCEPDVGTIGKGASLVAVEAAITGLSGATTYHFRLHARSAAGTIYTEDGSFPTSATAMVANVSSELAGGNAVLKAVINPNGSAVKYHFEYGECASRGDCVGSPLDHQTPGAELASGSSDVPVSAEIEGVTSGITYHFRVISENAAGETEPTPEGTFVLEPGGPSCSTKRLVVDGSLADCRGYEMVTPPAKNGALVDNGAFMEDPSIAADGSRVFALSLQCFEKSEACTGVRETNGTPYSFERGASGWATRPLFPSASEANNTMFAYSAETGMVLLARSAQPPALENLYARESSGALRAIGPIAETPGAQIGQITPNLRVATGGLSHVIYEGARLWPGVEAEVPERARQSLAYPGPVDGHPALVGVSDPGGASLISACGTTIGGNKTNRSDYGALSADGRAVFFTPTLCGSGTGVNVGVPVPAFRLYERVEAVGGGMRTVLVSGPGPEGVCDAECQKAPVRSALFEGAAADGSRVFFTDTGRLTNEASDDQQKHDNAFTTECAATVSFAAGCNLYAFTCPSHCEDETQRSLVDVSAGDVSGLGPRVQGVVAIPPDGSDVFFVAKGVLTGANGVGGVPVPGGENLYVYRFGAGGGAGSLDFIATLPESDSGLWSSGVGVANVSSDGRVLVFGSHGGLTADVSREEGPAQVYRYDVASKRLSRVSIGLAGFNDNGNGSVVDARIVNAVQGFEADVGPGRSDPSMSDNGDLVFFESSAGLVPGVLDDVHVTGNAGVLAENVYEWAADGVKPSSGAAACGEVNGCVSLISDGRDV